MANTIPKTRNVKKENKRLKLLEVRNCSTRLWSSIRCKRSPISLVSKNFIGSFINLMKKSEMSEMLIRVEICRSIFERIKSIAVRLKSSIICAIRTSQIKLMSLPPIPVSTIACVKNGKTSCKSEPNNNPKISCVKKRLYFFKYLQRNFIRFVFCSSFFSLRT